MKKKFLAIACTVTAACMAGATLAGCGLKSEKVQNEPGVVNILLMEAGYGVEFMDKWIEDFKKIPGNETIEFYVKKDVHSTETATNAFLDGDKNPWDLCFTGDITYKKYVNQGELEDISDVVTDFDNPLRSELNDIITYQNKQWIVPWAYDPCGLIYNTTLLPQEKVPVTTNELIALAKDINAGKIESAKNAKPFVWAGLNAADYWQYVTDVWWAQYEFLDSEYESGIDAYNKFWSLNDTDPDGYTVYQQPGLEKAFEVLQSLFSEKVSFINGSETKSHTDSQVDFVLERAAMLPGGGWLQNEMKEHYSDKKNYRMMKTPVISALGKELKLAGDNATDALHEEKLVAVVKAVDAGKDAATIATELGVDVSKAQTVLAARNLSVTIGINHQVWIPATSNAKENAKKFLTYMGSDSAAKIFREYSNSSLPFQYGDNVALSAETPFLQSINEINASCNFLLPQMIASSVRYKGGLKKFTENDDVIKKLWTGELTAASFVQGEYDYLAGEGGKWDFYYKQR